MMVKLMCSLLHSSYLSACTLVFLCTGTGGAPVPMLRLELEYYNGFLVIKTAVKPTEEQCRRGLSKEKQ